MSDYNNFAMLESILPMLKLFSLLIHRITYLPFIVAACIRVRAHTHSCVCTHSTTVT